MLQLRDRVVLATPGVHMTRQLAPRVLDRVQIWTLGGPTHRAKRLSAEKGLGLCGDMDRGVIVLENGSLDPMFRLEFLDVRQ
jgi:hypothetical protein